jgi:excinuclease UvrABC ATPase subunit
MHITKGSVVRMDVDTYIYRQEFEDGSIRYGRTKNIERRMQEHLRNFDIDFEWDLMVDRPVKLSTAKTIEALLIQRAFDDNIDCKNNYVENKRYLFENKDKLDSCPICEEIGCGVSKEYIEGLIKEHEEKQLEYYKEWRKNNLERYKEYYKEYNENNKEHFKEWRKNNPDKIKEWRKNNPDKIKEWRKNNPDKIKEYNKKWCKNNPEKKKYQNTIIKTKWRDRKAKEAGYKDRFDASKQLGIPISKIKWGQLDKYKEV